MLQMPALAQAEFSVPYSASAAASLEKVENEKEQSGLLFDIPMGTSVFPWCKTAAVYRTGWRCVKGEHGEEKKVKFELVFASRDRDLLSFFFTASLA